jgi:cell shape-determining protein MreC
MRGGTSYRPASVASGGRRRLFIASFTVLVILLIDLLSGGALRSLARTGTQFVSGGADALTASVARSGYFSTRGSLEAQIQALTVQIAQYQEKAAAYDALQGQYDSLSRLTHLAQTLPGVTAPITSSLTASPYGTFTIGAGRSDGVTPGDVVLSAEGFVIGDVASVGAHDSLVTELFAPGRSTNVTVHGASVALSGGGGNNARTQVPRGIAVAPGDVAIAPSFGGRSVGVVGNVASSSASAYSDVIVTLPVDLNVLRFVYVTPKK